MWAASRGIKNTVFGSHSWGLCRELQQLLFDHNSQHDLRVGHALPGALPHVNFPHQDPEGKHICAFADNAR